MNKSVFPFFAAIFISLIINTNIFSQNNSTVTQSEPELIFFAAVEKPVFTHSESPQGVKKSSAAYIEELEKSAFDLINRQREANGLKSLIWSEEAAKTARMHSQSMANNNFFSHKGLDGRTVDDRAVASGLKFWLSIGENIAFSRGYANPSESAVEMWMKSSGHRGNILNKGWKETGVGIAVAPDNAYYFTQVFFCPSYTDLRQ